MSVTAYEVRSGAYHDSVVLMQLQKALAALDGIEDAGVVMATPANKDLLRAAGFALDSIAAGADDLLLIVRAEEQQQADAALARVDELLQRRRSEATTGFRPRSLAAAAKMLPESEWVLVSVPGRYAAGVADNALELGKHVFLYSDNVSLADEIRLKQKADAAGRLLMGPDCGTAIVNGVGLGFANRVRRGPVGIVAASGTGLQAVSVAVHRAGSGISQALGTGGRDLKPDVEGVTMMRGIELLQADPDTRVVVLVSKPPAPMVAARVLARARQCGKPVVVAFLGYPAPLPALGNLHFAPSLATAGTLAAKLANSGLEPEPDAPLQTGRYLRALFSGGTLAYETLLALQSSLSPLASNLALHPDQKLSDVWHSTGHTILDMGEDAFTQGRLHPMMDNDLRLRRLAAEAADPETALIVLDVVLGEGAHPDPAAELAPAIAAAQADRPVEVAVLLVGTDEDPQDITAQAAAFANAGAALFFTVDELAAYVAQRLAPPANPHTSDATPFGTTLSAINVGLESFYDSIIAQGGAAVHVDWRPPAGGNEKMMALLAKMKPARR